MLERIRNALNILRNKVHGLQYHIDDISGKSITGWARNTRNPKHRPKVCVTSDGKLVGSGTAATFREDLLLAEMGDGYYGFNICPNIPSFMSGKTQVEIFIDNHKVADGTITPIYENTMIRFAADIEDRLDALLAIYKERTDREIAELTRQIRS